MRWFVFWLMALGIALSGCQAASMFFAKQAWSPNYTQEPGVLASDPAIIDGDLNTIGKSVFPQEVDASLRFPVSEVRIELPQPKMIRRIVIYSDNLVSFEIHTRNNLGHWKKVREIKSNKQSVIDVRLTARTDGIRIRVLRTTDDAAQRRKNIEPMRGNVMLIKGQIRAPAKIREIELYGYAEAH